MAVLVPTRGREGFDGGGYRCWAAWCGPCRAVAPVIDCLAAAYAGRVKVCKLDVDANPQVRSVLGVQGIPALFIVANGQVVDQLVGAHPYEAIDARLKAALARRTG